MEIAQAIAKAEDLAKQPEIILSSAQTVELVGALLAGIKQSKCYYKALKEGRRTFVLVEGDPAAGAAIYAWAGAAEIAGHRMEKVQDARAIGYAFSAAGMGDMRKTPD